MTLSVAIDHAGAAPGATRIASVAVLRTMAEAEPAWRALEAGGASATPYQRFDLQNAWQLHAGIAERVSPLIVVGYDARREPVAILPLGVTSEGGVRIAHPLGGKHTTFNGALWRKDVAEAATQADVEALLAGLKTLGERVDLVMLTQQAASWDGVANPTALLPQQESINECPLLTWPQGALPSDVISNSSRRAMRTKEKKLQVEPGYRYTFAETDADITRLLDAFFMLKPQRMTLQKLPNVFAEPGIEEFVREACLTLLPSGGRAMEVHGMECDSEVIAISAGVTDSRRMSVMFGTYTLSPNAKWSPGLILLRAMIDGCIARGMTEFDLGIGTDDYKRQFCKTAQPIFDTVVPLTTRGAVAAIGLSSLTRAKRVVKQTPALMHVAQFLRAALHR